MSQHVFLVEAGAARQPAPLEFLLQERLPRQLSAGQKAHRAAHTAARHRGFYGFTAETCRSEGVTLWRTAAAVDAVPKLVRLLQPLPAPRRISSSSSSSSFTGASAETFHNKVNSSEISFIKIVTFCKTCLRTALSYKNSLLTTFVNFTLFHFSP